MARFQRLACPSCGGALDVPTQHEQFFKCATCGATLEDTQYTAPTPQVSLSLADVLAENAIDTARLATYAVRAGRTATKLGKLVAGVTTVGVLGAAGAGAYGVYQAVDTATGAASGISGDGFAMYTFTNSAMFPGEGTTTEIATTINGPDDAHLLYVDLGAPEPLRWDAPLGNLLPASATIPSYERIVASAGQVLVTYENKLFAFDRTTGRALYQLGLSDSVSNICRDCLRIFGGRTAVALSEDGTLRAWDAATGGGGWSVPLEGIVPRQLLDIGGNPAVAVDQPDDREDGQDAILTVFDLADGTVLAEQAPRCRAGEYSWMTLHAYDHMIPLGDGSYVWLDDCVQRWMPGASEPAWEIPDDPQGPAYVDSLNGRELLAGDRLVIGASDGVAAISLADGRIVKVRRDEVSRRYLVALIDDIVVSAEYSSRGSGRWSLVGIDLTNPDGQASKPTWSVPLEGDPGEDSMITRLAWLAGVTPAGIAAVQVDPDAGAVRMQMVDPTTGTATVPTSLAIDDLTFAEVVGWRNGNLILGADDKLLAIDPATATIVNQAP